MRIGIVTSWQERGAAYVSRQYRDVLKGDHQVFIYARGGEHYAIGDKNWDDESVTWGKKIPIHRPMAIDLADFKTWILKNRLELVFFNEQQWWTPVILCEKLGVKTGSYIDYYTEETVPFFNVFDFLICNTKRHYEVFKNHPQSVYIPWGTDINVFKPKNFVNTVNHNFPVFFHSAGVSPERKGTDILLKAFKKIRKPAKLIIHSQIDLKSVYPDLRNLINELVISNRLELCAETVSAPGLYHLGDVYVYPSRLDGIGLSLPEALACGLPVITSNNQPMNEFIDRSNGLLIKIDGFKQRTDGYYWPLCNPNIESLSAAMSYYIDNFSQLINFRKQARAYAENNLNWEDNAKPLSGLINDFKKINYNDKLNSISLIEQYEKNRENFRTLLYRKAPLVFKPFSWLWPIIKRKYIKK